MHYDKKRNTTTNMAAVPEHSRTFSERLVSLLSFDCVRISRILETLQYSVLYGILGVFAGTFVDRICHGLYPSDAKTSRDRLRIVTASVIQTAIAAVLVLYIRKVAQLVPFLFPFCKEYIQHLHVHEYGGEIAIAIIYVGAQPHLVEMLGKYASGD